VIGGILLGIVGGTIGREIVGVKLRATGIPPCRCQILLYKNKGDKSGAKKKERKANII
jgi:hypothetical protein